MPHADRCRFWAEGGGVRALSVIANRLHDKVAQSFKIRSKTSCCGSHPASGGVSNLRRRLLTLAAVAISLLKTSQTMLPNMSFAECKGDGERGKARHPDGAPCVEFE